MAILRKTPLLEPILAPDLVDHVTSRLRDAILTGALAPGGRLVEEQLAAQLEVSRAPVREALRMLEYDGLVTALGRRGRFVSVLSARDAWEVYTLRENLEAMAFGLVVTKCPPEMLVEAGEIVQQMKSASQAKDRRALSQLDVRFHRLICSTSKHDRLIRTWDSMSNQIALLSRQVLGTQYDNLTDVADRHQLLIDVLRTDDREAATAAIRDHIQSVAMNVIKRLEAVQATQADDAGPAREADPHETQ